MPATRRYRTPASVFGGFAGSMRLTVLHWGRYYATRGANRARPGAVGSISCRGRHEIAPVPSDLQAHRAGREISGSHRDAHDMNRAYRERPTESGRRDLNPRPSPWQKETHLLRQDRRIPLGSLSSVSSSAQSAESARLQTLTFGALSLCEIADRRTGRPPRLSVRRIRHAHARRSVRLVPGWCKSDPDSSRNIRLTPHRSPACSSNLGASLRSPPQVIEIIGAQIRWPHLPLHSVEQPLSSVSSSAQSAESARLHRSTFDVLNLCEIEDPRAEASQDLIISGAHAPLWRMGRTCQAIVLEPVVRPAGSVGLSTRVSRAHCSMSGALSGSKIAAT